MQAILIPTGIIMALAITGTIHRFASRRMGDAPGWTAGTLVGFPAGCIVLLAALGNRYHPEGIVFFGLIGGLIAGAVTGPIIGAMSLIRNGSRGDVKDQPVTVTNWIGWLFPLVVFGSGMLALVCLIV
jgi:hypothetical protein